jgi:hypothetical protein
VALLAAAPEVDILIRNLRRREKLAKAGADARAAEMKADFEKKVAAAYCFDDDATWKAAAEAAEQEVQKAKKLLAARCAELGIPANFAPTLNCSWWNRGENASATRRAELRNVADAEISQRLKQAKFRIEQEFSNLENGLIAGSLETMEAQSFFAALPTLEQLLPLFSLAEVKSRVQHQLQQLQSGQDED